ncbi:MAG TPA: hydrogenase 3 maturation endopeptidase HyCI [Candidatus Acidoferrales bacterium]|nr:hydrogenase 3 maturation endopeptidase HyCI [Candidatus Acidoferrales bacterium]
MSQEIEKQLKCWLAYAKKVVIAGIGNPIRTDDYVGLKIVEALKGKLSRNVLLLEAETVPESYLQDIEEFAPSHVLLLDAAFLSLAPGEARLLDSDQIAGYSAVTTHLLPLRIFCDYIRAATEAKIALLLVEPKSMDFGEGLTAEVEAAAQRITQILQDLLG